MATADHGLDLAGRTELAQIVLLAESSPLAALQQVANLARRYPASPQVRLVAVRLDTDHLLRQGHGRVERIVNAYESIVDMDTGYVPSQHALCSARLAACCRWEVLSAEERHAFVEKQLPPMMIAMAERRYDQLGRHALHSEHDVLVDDWRTRCHDALRAYAQSLLHVDHSRYTLGKLEPYVKTCDRLATGTDVLRAQAVAIRWLEIWLPRVRQGIPPEVWPQRYA